MQAVSASVEPLCILVYIVLFKQARRMLLSSKIKSSYADVEVLSQRFRDPRSLISLIKSECDKQDEIYTGFLRTVSSQSLLKKLKKWPFSQEFSHYMKLAPKTENLVRELRELYLEETKTLSQPGFLQTGSESKDQYETNTDSDKINSGIKLNSKVLI